MRLPIRTRLTLVFAVLMMAILGVAGAFVYHTFAAQLDRVINGRLTALAKELAADIKDGETAVLQDFGDGDSEGFFGQVLNKDGGIVEKQDIASGPLLAPRDLQMGAEGAYFEKPIGVGNGADTRPVRLAAEAAVRNPVRYRWNLARGPSCCA
jgi:hypothetical protein